MSDNNGKVIPFPKQKKEVEAKEQKPPPTKSRRKVQGATVSGVLVLVAIFNVMVGRTKEAAREERGLASVRSLSDQQAWQNELATDLSKKPLRGLAMTGTRPALIDELQFGELKGQYAVDFEAGKIKGLHLADATSEAVVLGEPEQFLVRYRGIWPYSFERAEAGPVRTEGTKQYKTWKLYDKGRAFAEAEFVFIGPNQFQGLNFKKEQQ